jgi:hypothetical protein
MLNITKTTNGFIINEIDYTLQNFDNDIEGLIESVEYLITSETQLLIGTDKGVIYLDLSCTINGIEYTDINLFTQALKGE